MLIKPEEILLQEIKLASKSKIVDMVGIRHSTTNQVDFDSFISFIVSFNTNTVN